MKVGDLVKYKEWPHIYVVIGIMIDPEYDFVQIHCLEDGERVFENPIALEVINEDR